jgi:acetyl-CoA/propionyl-CoA carboxylase, biotin carboxylase, biotin carboxyl carrier protein
MKYRLETAGKTYDIDVELTSDGYLLRGPDGAAQRLKVVTRPDGSQRVITPWGELELSAARRAGEVWAHAGGRRLAARVERARPNGQSSANGAALGAVRAPMAGKVLRVFAEVGQALALGEPVVVIEAMKMENELVAPLDGVVAEVCVSAPQTVEKGALLVRIEPK